MLLNTGCAYTIMLSITLFQTLVHSFHIRLFKVYRRIKMKIYYNITVTNYDNTLSAF